MINWIMGMFFGITTAERKESILSMFTVTIDALQQLTDETNIQIEKRRNKANKLEEKANDLLRQNRDDNDEIASIQSTVSKLCGFLQ